MENREFPVHSVHKKYLESIPWEMIKIHEEQAKKNHGGQDLETLAKRGGCDLCEIFFILEDKPYDNRLTKIHEIEDFKYAIEEKIKEFRCAVHEKKLPNIKFVPFKESATREDLVEYMMTHTDDAVFLVRLRYRYEHENKWSYITDACCLENFDDILWMNDWWEGQQYVEYLGITQMN